MRILVTGSRGYIGTVLVPMLITAGHEVIGLDTDFYANCNLGKDLNGTPFVKKDIREIKPEDLTGFDAVIHLAALSDAPLGNLDPEITYDINWHGTVHLAKMAKKEGVKRFLFSSSCNNYSAVSDGLIDEDVQLNAVTPHGISEVQVEKDLQGLADDGFSPTYLRIATAYGFSRRMRFDVILNNFVACAYTTGKIFLEGNGTSWRPIVHLEDISRAFLAALHAPRELVHNQAFNVGRPGENYRIREIAEIVNETIEHSTIEYAKTAGQEPHGYCIDSNKIRRTLPEFQPQWTARQGIAQLYSAYRNNGVTFNEFEGPKYRRADHLKMLLSENRLDENLRWRDN